MRSDKTKYLILTGIFAALTAASAFLQIPLGFTSITLQTAMTILAGILLGPKYGSLSQAVYVLLGILGLPIFTKGGGIGYFLQPSMGFLLALIPAAYVAGLLYKKYKNIILACLAAEAIMYLIGTPYMGYILNHTMGLGYDAAKILKIGCLLYLPGDLVKCIAVYVLTKPLEKAIKSAKQ